MIRRIFLATLKNKILVEVCIHKRSICLNSFRIYYQKTLYREAIDNNNKNERIWQSKNKY